MVYQSTGLILFPAMMMGKIVEFKVMLRPQKAVEKAREQMMAALEQLNL